MSTRETPMTALTPAEKAYIKEIAREVVSELPCKVHGERLRKCEQKLFNGINTKINILFAIYSVVIAWMVIDFFF